MIQSPRLTSCGTVLLLNIGRGDMDQLTSSWNIAGTYVRQKVTSVECLVVLMVPNFYPKKMIEIVGGTF